MRSTILAEGEYYHIYNRGVEKNSIFYERSDYERFLLCLFALRGKKTIPHFSRLSSQSLALTEKIQKLNIFIADQSKLVEIICFCLMPNHYHLILKQETENGISSFMHRLGTSYTKFMNKKRERSGHLFESCFRAVHIDRNAYLVHLARYIHLNPINIVPGQLIHYLWSSYTDYVVENRWKDGLHPDIVLDQFLNPKSYRAYVENVTTLSIDRSYLIDES